MAVVKADAYGHGLVPMARELVRLGTPALGVSSIDEGILIRKKVSSRHPDSPFIGPSSGRNHCLSPLSSDSDHLFNGNGPEAPPGRATP